MNIAKHLERAAAFFPDRPSVRAEGREISYRELNGQASRIAAALSQSGLRPGDFIGLCAPNSPEWLAFYLGTLKAGATAVTFASQLPPEELTGDIRKIIALLIQAGVDCLHPVDTQAGQDLYENF